MRLSSCLLSAAVTLFLTTACARAQVVGPDIRQASAPAAAASQPNDYDEQAVRNLLGPSCRITRTEHFLLMHNGRGWPAGFDRRLDTFCEDFLGCLKKAGFTVNRPTSRLVWVGLSDRRGFDRYVASSERMALPWLEGYYSTRTNRVAVIMPRVRVVARGDSDLAAAADRHQAEPVGVELLHEAAHQLSFNCGLLKRGVMYPLWVTEGLATNFESGARDGKGVNPARQDRLVWTRSGSEMMPLAGLVVATRVSGEDDEARQVYAQSWGLFRFLLERKPTELKRYLESLAKLPVGRRTAETMRAEFESAFGPVKDLDAEWDGYVAGLDIRPRVAAAKGEDEGR